jgi:class 3 adenylate cyclase/tetratricopeptide (TPR) repeat protein
MSCGASLSEARPIEGERRFITVLFCDVVGSTGIGEQLDPEQVTEVMNGAFVAFNSAVGRYGGTVARLMGDAILALFGAPIAHEDDAERAVRAGLEILSAAEQYGERVRQAYGVDFNVRVGIHSGLAVLAFVGDELKTEYTAMGDTTNVASRLQGAADPGTVLVSSETRQLVGDLFDFTPRGRIEVKGKSVPIEVYEATALRDGPRSARGISTVEAPLVGRDAELGDLRRRLEELRAGRGALVAVTGEAGLGKSRLADELRAASDVTWLDAGAVSYGGNTALHLWQHLLRTVIGASAGDSADAVRDRLEAACLRWHVHDEDRAALESIMAIESPGSLQILARLEGGDLALRLARAVRAFLSGMARTSPVVLVLDDLHWADAPSMELLVNVAEIVTSTPLLLLCLLRPERDSAGWLAVQQLRGQLGDRWTQIMLEPLGSDDAGQLLERLLHGTGLPEHTRALILQRSDGNPFFLEEVTRALIAPENPIGEQAHTNAMVGGADVTIPETLSGLLSARIDHLAPDAKRVLQSAAVIGRTFSYRVLAALEEAMHQSVAALDSQLAILSNEDLVREWSRDPEVEYVFKHALTQEAAYSLLLVRRRRILHRHVGEVLGHLYPDRSEELAATLAHHFWNAEDWQRAAQYGSRAGARAAKVYARREAMEHYLRAYEAWKKSPDAAPQALHDVILAWAAIAVKFRPPEEVIEKLKEAEGIARGLGDKSRLAQTLVWIANVHFLTGFRSRGTRELVQAHQLSRELGDERMSILPLFLTTAAMVDEHPRPALRRLARVIDLAEKYGLKEVHAHAVASKGLAHARLGEAEAAAEYTTRALELAPTIQSRLIEADVEMTAALAFYDLGDTERALELGQSGAQKALEVRGLECACEGFFIQGLLHLQNHDTAAALAALHESSTLSQFAGFEDLRNRVRAALAIAQVLDGRAEALADVEDSLRSARAMADDFGAAFITHGLAEIATQRGDLDRATGHLQAALDYYRGKQIQPKLAQVLQSLANVYEQAGHVEQAEEARAEAQRLLERLQSASSPRPAREPASTGATSSNP